MGKVGTYDEKIGWWWWGGGGQRRREDEQLQRGDVVFVERETVRGDEGGR